MVHFYVYFNFPNTNFSKRRTSQKLDTIKVRNNNIYVICQCDCFLYYHQRQSFEMVWMQEKIGKLMSEVEERSKSNSALMVRTQVCAEKEKKQGGKADERRKEVAADDHQQLHKQTSEVEKQADKAGKAATASAAEEKAAKIRRLKSGFRICKPQGTFLWPDMARTTNTSLSPQVVVQVGDQFVVPTPPSVSSSTASAPPSLPHHHHHAASPVKPLAERRGLTITVTTVSDGPRCYAPTTTAINLNDTPFRPAPAGGAFCTTPSSVMPNVSLITDLTSLASITVG